MRKKFNDWAHRFLAEALFILTFLVLIDIFVGYFQRDDIKQDTSTSVQMETKMLVNDSVASSERAKISRSQEIYIKGVNELRKRINRN